MPGVNLDAIAANAPDDDACGLCFGDGRCPECNGTGDRPLEKQANEVERLRALLRGAAHAFEELGFPGLAAAYRDELGAW